jgi:hypothetical protein
MCGIQRPLLNRDALEWVIRRLKDIEDDLSEMAPYGGGAEHYLHGRQKLVAFREELESWRTEIRA